MENVSKALVLAIQYSGAERNDGEYTEEDDLKIVEESASLVQSATEGVLSVLVSMPVQAQCILINQTRCQ